MKGNNATDATPKASAPRRQKSRSRQVLCLVNRIAVETARGTSDKLNQEIVVIPDMKKATPNQTARFFVRSRENNTSASNTSGIHIDHRYGSCDSKPKRNGTNAKMIPAIQADPFEPVSVRTSRKAP